MTSTEECSLRLRLLELALSRVGNPEDAVTLAGRFLDFVADAPAAAKIPPAAIRGRRKPMAQATRDKLSRIAKKRWASRGQPDEPRAAAPVSGAAAPLPPAALPPARPEPRTVSKPPTAPPPDPDRAAIAAFVAERGVTRCPTVYVGAVEGGSPLRAPPPPEYDADTKRFRRKPL
jgi:hypothetical protein